MGDWRFQLSSSSNVAFPAFSSFIFLSVDRLNCNHIPYHHLSIWKSIDAKPLLSHIKWTSPSGLEIKSFIHVGFNALGNQFFFHPSSLSKLNFQRDGEFLLKASRIWMDFSIQSRLEWPQSDLHFSMCSSVELKDLKEWFINCVSFGVTFEVVKIFLECVGELLKSFHSK
jgi:hypothetical protein